MTYCCFRNVDDFLAYCLSLLQEQVLELHGKFEPHFHFSFLNKSPHHFRCSSCQWYHLLTALIKRPANDALTTQQRSLFLHDMAMCIPSSRECCATKKTANTHTKLCRAPFLIRGNANKILLHGIRFSQQCRSRSIKSRMNILPKLTRHVFGTVPRFARPDTKSFRRKITSPTTRCFVCFG